jgi:hypothetical protein
MTEQLWLDNAPGIVSMEAFSELVSRAYAWMWSRSFRHHNATGTFPQEVKFTVTVYCKFEENAYSVLQGLEYTVTREPEAIERDGLDLTFSEEALREVHDEMQKVLCDQFATANRRGRFTEVILQVDVDPGSFLVAI